MKYLILSFFLSVSSLCFAETPGNSNPKPYIPTVIKIESADTGQIFMVTTFAPKFGTSPADWSKYIQANLIYPDKAKQEHLEGKVVINFVVERDGRITNFKIWKSLSPECDAEAIRLVKNSPKWKPAIAHGVNVRCIDAVAILFPQKSLQ
jgi:protein TonB